VPLSASNVVLAGVLQVMERVSPMFVRSPEGVGLGSGCGANGPELCSAVHASNIETKPRDMICSRAETAAGSIAGEILKQPLRTSAAIIAIPRAWANSLNRLRSSERLAST
jgi:hypothetical protein